MDVRFGQGYLFAQPRPVRAEALTAPELPLMRPAEQPIARSA
jgi:EAL domain-containing protein (putative c-di-GMP-specific phosphodiesterase class I)